MQVEGNWKAAANLTLLLGNTHPPARLEKPLLTPQQRAVGSPSAVAVDARNTANFRSSSFCGLQEKTAPSVRKIIVSYYKELLRRIPLWRSTVKKHDGVADPSAVVKPEPQDDDAMGMSTNPDLTNHSGGQEDDLTTAPAVQHVAAAAPLFRAVGILTQVHDPSAVSAAVQQAPWEFYVVRDIDDEDCYTRALQAMTQQPSAAAAAFLLLQDNKAATGRTSGTVEGGSSTRASTGAMGSVSGAGEETAATRAEADEEAASQDGTRLSLYTRQVPQFTGLYPGMAVGVVGEAFQRSARGVLTGVLVREFILPARPLLPWRVDRPLPASVRHAVESGEMNNSSANGTTEAAATAARIHFCSGPFPRRDVAGLLRTVTQQALHRGADVLIIGGPFILPFTSDFERGLLPALGATFNETLESFVDTLEETVRTYYASRPLVPHMKVLLVSHKGDVTQVPVLPTTMYAIADTDDILVRSNPCRLSINGVHVSVCNDDVVGAMRERMVERWPTAEGSLRRVVEALVDGRLFTPLYSFPVTSVDLKHLPQLRMDYVPARNELLDIESPGGASSPASSGVKKGRQGDDEASGERVVASRSWDAVLHLNGDAAHEVAKAEVKRAKAEPAEDAESPSAAVTSTAGSPSSSSSPSPASASAYRSTSREELMPHIMFLPSTRPQFAVVTHQNEDVDGADIDNTARASGVLVVNQEVWSTRSSPKFQLRVAEVTIPNTELVLRRGASAANGVACGVLNIYSAQQ